MELFQSTYLADILHEIAQGMLMPTIIVIILLLLVSIFFVGQVIMEYFSERKHFKQNMPEIVNAINNADYDSVTGVVVKSKLLIYQKSALVTVSKNMGLPEDPLFALAQSEVNGAEKIYKKRLSWTDLMAKIAPLFGLMGTLIPLGPGIVALGQGDTLGLSQSLLLAFDSTVCGLICAVLALVLSKIRSGWYADYINTLEAVMSCVIDKAAQARKSGIELPANYSDNPIPDINAENSTKKEAK